MDTFILFFISSWWNSSFSLNRHSAKQLARQGIHFSVPKTAATPFALSSEFDFSTVCVYCTVIPTRHTLGCQTAHATYMYIHGNNNFVVVTVVVGLYPIEMLELTLFSFLLVKSHAATNAGSAPLFLVRTTATCATFWIIAPLHHRPRRTPPFKSLRHRTTAAFFQLNLLHRAAAPRRHI